MGVAGRNAGTFHTRILEEQSTHPRGGICIEGENSIVVEQCLLDVLVERDLSAQLERVLAVDPTENVAGRVEICAGGRAADLLSESEVPRDGDLGQIRRALNREC